MKRTDITELFPDATDEQIKALLDINGTDINTAKKGTDDLRTQLNTANQELEGLRGNQENLTTAQNRVQELETELNGLKAANQLREMREGVAKATGVPADLLTGDTEELCTSQAKGILDFAKYPSVPDGGEVHGAGAATTREQFAEWLGAQF